MRALRISISSEHKKYENNLLGYMCVEYFEDFNSNLNNKSKWTTYVEFNTKNGLIELDEPHWDFIKEENFYPYNHEQIKTLTKFKSRLKDIAKSGYPQTTIDIDSEKIV